ncbi:HD domain-containing protein [Deinococcus radiomollis]|uniref:HD domain-containing protein n=1 Tax=Deinococcus radiomollis TaxID=468916 RepID=UPI003891CB39
MQRLQAQIEFLLTCDQLKSVTRQNRLHDGSRPENSAEHSWHLALMALTLSEYAPDDTDIVQVVRLLITHDLVEIYAGDAYIESSVELQAAQTRKEQAAAEQLFALVPSDQSEEFHELWNEFEARQTLEAKFARELDALAPAMLTWGDGGQGRTDWGPPTAVYLAMKRRTMRHPVFLALFGGWMEREGVLFGEVGPVSPRLQAQIGFLQTCDPLKAVQRSTYVHDGSRPENSAEHSWHLALMALTLSEYAPTGTDVGHVVRLLLVHDLVEIGAGDLHFAATQAALDNQSKAEAQAAQALSAFLPPDQQLVFYSLSGKSLRLSVRQRPDLHARWTR